MWGGYSSIIIIITGAGMWSSRARKPHVSYSGAEVRSANSPNVMPGRQCGTEGSCRLCTGRSSSAALHTRVWG